VKVHFQYEKREGKSQFSIWVRGNTLKMVIKHTLISYFWIDECQVFNKGFEPKNIYIYIFSYYFIVN
jgi:hypothetical protein